MKTCEKELLFIKQCIDNCEDQLNNLKDKEAYWYGFDLIQEVKKPVLDIIESNNRDVDIINTCERMIELLIRSGSMSFKESPTETVQLSVILNYCCFLLEEFNLRKEVADYLYGTYNEWYSSEEFE